MRFKSFKSNAINRPAVLFATVLLLTVAAAFLASPASASDPLPGDPGSGDWPMWGGTPDRNMISNMKGLPTSWDVKSKKNVKPEPTFARPSRVTSPRTNRMSTAAC